MQVIGWYCVAYVGKACNFAEQIICLNTEVEHNKVSKK